MKKIIFEFRHYSDGSILVFAKGVLVALTGNTFFPTISPSLATLQTGINAYDDAYALVKAEGGKGNIGAKNARKAELIQLLVDIALDLMKISGGSEEMLLTTAYPLNKNRQPVPPIGIPEILRIENGESLGSLEVTVKWQPGVKMLMYEYTPEPLTADSVWSSHNSTSIKAILSGLISGKKYWCRVVAFGSGDQAMVSDASLSRLVQ